MDQTPPLRVGVCPVGTYLPDYDRRSIRYPLHICCQGLGSYFASISCKTTTKKCSFSNYLYSLYSFDSVLNKSTYGVHETKYNSIQKIHMPAEICL